ncbi:MAG: DUF2155 domain-containing protein [Nitrospirota bacterium]
MKKELLILMLCLLLTFSLSSCKKKETQPVPRTPVPTAPMPMPPGQMPQGPVTRGPVSPERPVPPPGMMMARGKTQVVVPGSVKGKWSAAKILVEDKTTKNIQEYTVKLNSDFTIPDSNVKIHIGEFLPDFRMEGLTLTSASNQPNNPALGVRVFEAGKQIFPTPGKQWGWLFAKVPTIHSFKHSRYSIILKEGVKKV